MSLLLDKVMVNVPDAVIFDIDGVISDPTHRLHLIAHLPTSDPEETARAWNAFHEASVDDPPHFHIIQLMATFRLCGYRIVLCTGRSDKHRDITVQWLNKYVHTPYDALLMRREGDWRPDHMIKSEMLDLIRDLYKMKSVWAIEDRESVAAMYQAKGVPCLLYKHSFKESEHNEPNGQDHVEAAGGAVSAAGVGTALEE